MDDHAGVARSRILGVNLSEPPDLLSDILAQHIGALPEEHP
jgi:hypothetical protein